MKKLFLAKRIRGGVYAPVDGAASKPSPQPAAERR
jgi:hypothetical protein